MRIAITGGTGLIGRALGEALLAEGHTVIVFTRRPDLVDRLPPGAQPAPWTPADPDRLAEVLRGADAVVNLVGENIAQGESSRSLTPQELCQKLMAGWLESPTHRQNIFSAEYTRLGVGVVGRKGKYYATQLFALNHYQFHRVTLQEVKENYYRLTCDFTTTAKQIDVWINGEYSRSYTPRAEGQVHYQQDFREETGQYKIQLAADTLVSYTISLDTDVPLSQAMEEEQNSKRIIMQTIHLQGVTVTSYLLRGKGRVLADVKVVRVALDGTMLESVNIGPERELAFEVRLPKNSGRHKVGLYPQHGPKYTILNLFFVDTDRPLRRAFIPRFQ